MRVVRNISLILLGIAIWVAGFIFISIPAIDRWNDCWIMNRLYGGADSGPYCHVNGVIVADVMKMVCALTFMVRNPRLCDVSGSAYCSAYYHNRCSDRAAC